MIVMGLYRYTVLNYMFSHLWHNGSNPVRELSLASIFMFCTELREVRLEDDVHGYQGVVVVFITILTQHLYDLQLKVCSFYTYKSLSCLICFQKHSHYKTFMWYWPYIWRQWSIISHVAVARLTPDIPQWYFSLQRKSASPLWPILLSGSRWYRQPFYCYWKFLCL